MFVGLINSKIRSLILQRSGGFTLYENLGLEYIRIAFLLSYVGGYEMLYAPLEQILSWDAPSYEMLTKERYEATIEYMRRGEFATSGCRPLCDRENGQAQECLPL